ncbi:MAG: hypothetical protein RQ741_05615 [Wenzhouxiangellaceae bacterium]|nr:hypothetical protein [Wenzhouxiangellaceae bacterium]
MNKNQFTLIMLFALFLGPVVLAIVLHSEWIDWQAAPNRAHGTLIKPVQALGPFELVDAAGNGRDIGDLEGRWWLMMIHPDRCDADCMEKAILLRQIRLAQDRNRKDVGLAFMTAAQMPESRVDEIQAIDPSWVIFDGQAGAQLMRRFPNAESGAFYIVDPDGNIMERFDPTTDPTGIRKDLDRLLTWTIRE